MDSLRIGYFSDLHTEFLRSEAALTPKDHRIGRTQTREAFAKTLGDAYREADVIVAAGDIGIGAKSVQFLALSFTDKEVIYVPGNHDYWDGEIYSTQRKMRDAAAGTRVHCLLNSETVEIAGVLFCGATLWTDYELTGSKYAMDRAEDLMNDFRKIRLRRYSGVAFRKDEAPARLRAIDLLSFHGSHLRRIVDACADAHDRDLPLVVVTHHAPSALSLMFEGERKLYMQSGLRARPNDCDPCYASHLDYILKDARGPQVWIHGHTHIATAYQVGSCRVVSNPMGYAEGDETGWEVGKTIEVRTG